MILQDGAGAGVGHGTFEHALDGLSFAFIGNHVHDDFALENLGNTHAESVSRHSFKGGEPAFAQLLTAAGFIQFDDQEGFISVKVSRGIIESDMAVFADADKGDVNGVVSHDFFHFSAESGRIFGVAVDKVDISQLAGQFADEVFFQIETESGLMSGRRPGVV